MRRITVVAVTALATLAATAATVACVFTVSPAIGPAGSILLLRGGEVDECRDGGGCAVMSEREFQQAMHEFAMKLRRNGVLQS